MIAIQALERMKHIHSCYYIHRDIKPENFTIGMSKDSRIYSIDLGLGKRFRKKEDGSHIPMKKGKSLTGTARYASLNSHAGYEQSRRDDLESLGYMLVYFLKGKLPWQGLDAKDKDEKYEKIRKLKEETSLRKICEDIPNQFEKYLNY